MFKNKLVVITGGSSGLGAELARRFIATGAHVALLARDVQKLAVIQAELAPALGTGQKLATYSCDVIDFAACERTMRRLVDQMGTPDVLINSAGLLREGYFDTLPMSAFQETMDVNYFGVLHCVRATLPYFQRAGSGRIVNIASMAGKVGTFGLSAYCASKFALVGLTEVLRSELTPRNIAVQLVCPGEFDTPMVRSVEATRTPENRVITHTVPPATVEEVANDVFRGIVNNRYSIIPGRITRVIDTLSRLLPGVLHKVLDARLKRVYVGPQLR
jgi:3-dehydrosphinganine reductase